MNTKILLIALSAAAFSSCSTAYKTGQTPDDVYYSPVRPDKPKVEKEEDYEKRYVSQYRNRPTDYRIMMSIRDNRWRDLDYDYDYGYQYQYSPYSFSSGYTNYGYYYNPCYNTWPVYTKLSVPVNSTPRKVNLNSYSGYNTYQLAGNKSAAGVMWSRPSSAYNNSNTSTREPLRRQTDIYRQPSSNTDTRSNDTRSNDTRSYTPSSSSSSSGSSSSGSSSGSVSRPNRGG